MRILSLLIAFLLVRCTSPFVGRWESTKLGDGLTSAMLELHSNGTLFTEGKSATGQTRAQEGTWTATSENTARLIIAPEQTTTLARLSSKDELTVYPQGAKSEIRFTRAK